MSDIDAGTFVISTDFIRPVGGGMGLRLIGSTSGYVGLKPADAAGSIDFTLPAADGTSGQVMTTNGSGVLSFSTIDHGSLSGLTDDDHPIYLRTGGRFGGQLLYGGTTAGSTLRIASSAFGNGRVDIETWIQVRDDNIRFLDSSAGTTYAGLQAPSSADNTIYTLPASDGSSGDVMTTNGSGVMTWTTPSAGVTDHGALTGLTDDDHTQYAKLTGRPGSGGNAQSFYGGVDAGDDLLISSTTNATQGYVRLNTAGGIDSVRIREVGNGLAVYGSSSGYVGLKSPASLTGYDLTLPSADGTNGQAIVTNGAGVLSFADAGVTDHGALTGLTDDDHTQYALLAGRSGGQTIYGGTGASDDLVLRSTSNATTGDIFLHDSTILIADKSGNSLRTSTTPTNDNGIVNRGYMRTNNLTIGSAQTGNFTASAGTLSPVTLTSAISDLQVTFPISPTTGEKFGFFVDAAHSSGGSSTNFADRPYFCVEPANSTSINGSAYSSVGGEGGGKYSLWLAGEMLMFQYTGSTWLLIEDGRIPHICTVERSTDQSISNSSSASISWNSEVIDNAALHSTSSNADRIYFKRSNNYDYLFNARWDSNSTGLRQTWLEDSVAGILVLTRKPASGNSGESLASIYAATATNYAFARVFQDSGGSLNFSSSGSNFTLSEKLSR